MKILFTSVGRRVELVQSFKTAAEELKTELVIVGADIDDSAPALSFCDEQAGVCKISDKNYLPELLEICLNKKIDCLIPTIDTDLIVLSENKKQFENIGTKVLVSSPEKIRICRDKSNTAKYFLSLGLKAPLTFNSIDDYKKKAENGGTVFPAFIKPIDGSSSINTYKANDFDELLFYSKKIKNYIVQQFIEGREYTVDIFCDYDGCPVYITPRERLAVRAGEVSKTQIVQDDRMISEMKKIISNFKPCGQITVQLIRDIKTGEDYYIEINPRFGGGAPLSFKAGANSAEAVIRMLNGEQLQYHSKTARDGAIYCRFDQSICVNP